MQSATNVLAALARQSAIGTPASSGAGASQLRLVDSPGLKLERGQIRSAEKRQDQIQNMGRLGGKNANGTFNTELTVGSAIDLLLESIARGTWSAALPIASVSITTTTSTIVRATGDWLADGLRQGDIVTITLDTETANNDIRLRATAVSATTITVAGTPLTTNASPRSVTVTRLKKVIAPSTPIYHAYTIEQYDVDIDESELFVDTRLTNLAAQLQPNSPVSCAWQFQGLDRQHIATAAAPYFTNPDLSTGLALIADDSWIRYNGADIVTLTGLNLTFAINAALQAVIGSVLSPDVFMNDMMISGDITAIREDLSVLDDFDAETEFEIQVVLTEPVADPKPTIGIYLPRVKVAALDAQFLGGDAAKVETRNLMIGPHPGSSSQDATAVAFFSSAS